MAADQETKSHESVAEDRDTGLRRDSTFYQDGTVVFRVEGTLFKVPRRGFESGSGVFATMFSLPSVLGHGEKKEGQSDETPIILEGIQEDDFRSLLHLMYPIKPGDPDVPQSGLISALHLATMWDLKDIRRYAIARLDSMTALSSLEKVILAKQEMVQSWLLSGYEELVGVQNLSLQEINVLDWETIAKLFYVQKEIFGNSAPQCGRGGKHTVSCRNCAVNVKTACCIKEVKEVKEVRNAHELIREVFEVELKGMECCLMTSP